MWPEGTVISARKERRGCNCTDGPGSRGPISPCGRASTGGPLNTGCPVSASSAGRYGHANDSVSADHAGTASRGALNARTAKETERGRRLAEVSRHAEVGANSKSLIPGTAGVPEPLAPADSRQ